MGVTGLAYKKDTNGQPARETGLAAKPSERQVGIQQPTCLNWSQGASRWPAPGLERAFPAGLVSLLDPGPGVWLRVGTAGAEWAPLASSLLCLRTSAAVCTLPSSLSCRACSSTHGGRPLHQAYLVLLGTRPVSTTPTVPHLTLPNAAWRLVLRPAAPRPPGLACSAP